MIFTTFVLLIALGLFAGMVVLLEVGRRIGIYRRRNDPEGAREGVGAVEGAIFGLLGLLIAFTFSGAAARFDQRRHLIVEETNAIRTAFLLAEVLVDHGEPSTVASDVRADLTRMTGQAAPHALSSPGRGGADRPWPIPFRFRYAFQAPRRCPS
jgi:hypothetical protein